MFTGAQFPDPSGGFWQVTDPINITIGPPNTTNADQLRKSPFWAAVRRPPSLLLALQLQSLLHLVADSLVLAVFKMNPPSNAIEPVNLTNAYQNVTTCNPGDNCACPATNSNSTLAYNSTSYSTLHPTYVTYSASLPLVMGANVSSALTGFQIAQVQPYFNGSTAAYVSSTSLNLNATSRVNGWPNLNPSTFGTVMLPTLNTSQSSTIPGDILKPLPLCVYWCPQGARIFSSGSKGFS